MVLVGDATVCDCGGRLPQHGATYDALHSRVVRRPEHDRK